MDLTTTKKLNNGVDIPCVGLGVFQSAEHTADAVRWALEAGYRHIDTAKAYNNEADVARGIAASGVKREDIFITTKLFNTDMRAGRQREAIEESFRYLDTDYIDLLLIHWPVEGRYVESWKIMEEYYRAGRIRAIGVSNFNPHHLEDIFAASDIVPAVNQIELHPLLTQEPLLAYCREKGIAVEAWSPLGGTGGTLMQNPVLAEIAAQYGKSVAQLLIRWHLQRGVIVLPKSVHQRYIEQNAQVFDFAISEADMERISALNQDQRVGPDPDDFDF